MYVVRSRFVFLASLSCCLAVACGTDGGELPLSGDENVGGVVVAEQGPVAGALVSVHGASPPVEVVTNANGQFALEVPVGTPTLLVELDGYWRTLSRVHVQADEVVDDLEIEIVSDARVAEVASALGRSFDEANGVLLVEFYAAGAALGGEHAELDVETDVPFTFDEAGAPVESDTLLDGDGEAELVFTNVPVGDLDLIVFGDDTETGCAPEFDSAFDGRWPIAAGAITRARAFCGPI